jgi:hypothetical protein
VASILDHAARTPWHRCSKKLGITIFLEKKGIIKIKFEYSAEEV